MPCMMAAVCDGCSGDMVGDVFSFCVLPLWRSNFTFKTVDLVDFGFLLAMSGVDSAECLLLVLLLLLLLLPTEEVGVSVTLESVGPGIPENVVEKTV